jgi:hypothetical protein
MQARTGLVAMSLLAAAPPSAALAWDGMRSAGDELAVARFDFAGAGGGNENYYDGDFGDFDGDGWADRAVISRYGLLWNAGGGIMIPVSTQRTPFVPPSSSASLTGYLFGDEVAIGNDGVQWVDVDGDLDLDVVQGGNGEPFVVQINRGGRFAVTERLDGSALDIVSIDLERDGDADLVVGCWFPSGPEDLSVFVNDGTGRFTEEAAGRGLSFASDRITGIAAGDLDRDGDFDVLLASQLAEELWVMENDGRGRFTRSQRLDFPGPFRRGGFGQGMSLGDIDDDGDLDLAMAHEDYTGAHGRVAHGLYVNDGTGVLVEESASRFDIGAASFIGRLVGDNGKLADLDYDGDLDFFVFTQAGGPPLNFQLFLNDGTGRFLYTEGLVGLVNPTAAGSDGTGADADVTDLNRDGSYDVWVGVAGGLVTPLLNTYVDPSGLPADVPRDVRVSAEDDGLSLSWSPPPFAATARHYVVYRSLAAGREERDREVLRVVAISRFEDEGFAAPITRFTTTDELGAPDVTLDAGRVTLVDRTAVPGVAYAYSVAHVGPENIRSVPTAEVIGALPAVGVDTTAPEIAIVSPRAEAWSAHPRLVVTFADGGVGIDAESLSVTLDQAAGSIPAGAELAPRGRLGDGAWVLALGPDEALPTGVVTLRASIADRAGRRAERSLRFAVTLISDDPPSVTATASVSSGPAPLEVVLTGTGEDDGEILRWEWTFDDATTGSGRSIRRVFAREGTHVARLVATDDEGGVAEAEVTIVVGPCEGRCDADAGAPLDAAPLDGGAERDATTDRVPIRAAAGCGGCAASRAEAPSAAMLALAGGLIALGRLRRRRASASCVRVS